MSEKLSQASYNTDPKEVRRQDYLRRNGKQEHGTSNSGHGHIDQHNVFKRYTRKQYLLYEKGERAQHAQRMNAIIDDTSQLDLRTYEDLQTEPFNSDDEPTEGGNRLILTLDRNLMVNGFSRNISEAALTGVLDGEYFNHNELEDEVRGHDEWRTSSETRPHPMNEPKETEAELEKRKAEVAIKAKLPAKYFTDTYDDGPGDEYVYDNDPEDPGDYLRDPNGELGELDRVFGGGRPRSNAEVNALTDKELHGASAPEDEDTLPDYVSGFHVTNRP